MRRENETSTPTRPWLCGLALAVLLLGARQASADEPVPTTAFCSGNDSCFYPDYGPCDLFVRGGPIFTVGKSALVNRLETGWTLQAGIRKPFCCPHPWLDLYGELAGFYGNNHGDDVFVVTSGVVNTGPGQITDADGNTIDLGAHRTEIPDYLNTRLNSIERAGIQFAIGSYYLASGHGGLNLFQGSAQFNWRGGIRAGGIRAQYEQFPTRQLEAFIRNANAEDREPLGFRFTSNVEQPEIFVGLFASAGIGTTWDRFAGFDCTVTLGFDVEIAIDYVDTGDFAKGDNGLATWSPTLSLTFAW